MSARQMDGRSRARHGWRSVAMLLLAFVAVTAQAAPPYKYYLLAPEQLSADLAVMSLEPANTISVGPAQLSLGQYARGVVPSAVLLPGQVLSGTGQYSVGSSGDATDLLAPDFFAGTSFVVPHITGSHKYYVQATAATANLTIRLGATTDNLQVVPGTAYEIDAGSDNAIAGRIDSDQPIVVVHVAYVSGVARHAYPVPPASTELAGIRSQSVVLGATTNGTAVTVYTSDAASTTYSLNAGEKIAVAIGGSGSQGTGASIHITSNQPIAAVQYDDGDGDDATAFWPVSAFARRYGIPVNAQYVAVACLQSGVTVTLFKGSSAPETQTCSASGNDPGKVYFGANTSGNNVSAGWFLHASAPVYAMYEAATPEDEHNLSGAQSAAGPATPTLNTLVASTTSNPLSISGSAPASLAVRLYVNGVHQQTTTASGGGTFAFDAELFDGNNVVHVVAVSAGGDESDPSNVEQVTYSNTVSRTQTGTISGNVVWTPGNPATPYVVTGTLTIASGGKLVLQSGAMLKFANGASLTVNGTLKVAGTSTNPVTLTSNAASPTRGIWPGIVLNATATGSSISGALIEWATTGVVINGVPATIRGNTIRNFSDNGIYMVGAGANGSAIQDNLVDNLNDSVDCIEINTTSVATVSGNTFTNCSFGLHLVVTNLAVGPNNTITGNDYGVQMWGGNSTPQPSVTNSRIYANDVFNVRSEGFGAGASALVLNYTGNWWGSTDPTAISSSILDLSDNYSVNSLPTVNYGGFRNGLNGTPVPGNQLIGAFTATSTTLMGGATYDVLGVLFLGTGKTLTVPAGVTLRFHGNAFLVVDGSLVVQGAIGSMVTMTSGRPAPGRGNWSGIYVRSGSGTQIDYALIEWTSTAVNVNAVPVSVRNSTIRNFTDNGVYLGGAGTNGSVIENNLIDNLNDQADCIEILSTSVASVTGNTFTNCNFGLHLVVVNLAVSGNVITGNNIGVQMWGGNVLPQPSVTGSRIFANNQLNVRPEGFAAGASNMVLNFTGNWWGSTDPTTIAAGIFDLSDSYAANNLPTINYGGFLNAPNGTAVPGNFLMGQFTATSTTLTGGTTYDVLGVVYVPTGKSLTIPAATTLRFHGGAFLVVDGTLTIQGTASTPVTITSGRSSPARGNWGGIYVRSGSGTVIDYALIEWTTNAVNVNGVPVTIRNSTIRNFTDNGIYLGGVGTNGSVIQDNLIDNLNDQADCIEILSTSSATITGNTFTNCNFGLHLVGTSLAVSGNVITSNNIGVQMWGGNALPTPSVTGSRIFANNQLNVRAEGFAAGASNLVLNYTGNWWGSTDPTAIAGGIQDLSDSYTANNVPVVNFTGWLNAVNGTPVTGNYLFGPLTATSTTLTGGTTYDVVGVLIVPSGKSLTIPAGATLRFYSNAFLVVDGTLTVQGASGNPVTLTSGALNPARGNWNTLYVRGGSGTVIDYAVIEWAANGVYLNVPATVRNSTIRNFSDNGIYVNGTGPNGSVIQDNLIDNLNDQADCIEILSMATGTVTGNTFTNCNFGLHLVVTSLAVGANDITSNNIGVQMWGGNALPQPSVTGARIYANNQYNVRAEGFAAGASNLVLNYTGNWWGSTDPVAIAASILDLGDNYTANNLPTVNFTGYRTAPNGSVTTGNFLIGALPAASTTLTSGTTYDVMGVTYVSSGKSLTIPAGTTLRFHSNAFLVVDGTLSVQGSASTRARFTSGRAVPARGDWYGILVRGTSTGTVIDYALIEWATRGVDVQSANVTISNSIIRNFSTAGIQMTGSGPSSQITGNYIDNLTKTGDGIFLTSASPSITGNRIQRTNTAIYMNGASNPVVTGNTLTENNWGIYLYGANSNSATAVPRPTITGNDIFGNTNAQLEVNAYGASNPAVITATGNWWGTATPAAGTHIKFSSGSPTGSVNFSSPASAPLNGAASASLTVSEPFFSPNADAVKDTTTIQATLSQSSSWTLTIRSLGGAAVRTYSGSGTGILQAWDGMDGSSTVQPDGIYDCEVAVGGSPIGYCTTTLDATAPTSTIASPAASSTLQNSVSVPVTGSAMDPQLVSYTLDFGAGASPSSYTTIQTQAAGVSNGLLGTWVVSSTTGGAPLANGLYSLRLRASDRAGNVGVLTVPVSLDNISVSTITQNLEQIRPMQSEQLQIGFTLSAPSTAHLRIYPEQGGALVKEMSETFATAGAKTLSWDGRNTAGVYVPDEAYSYTLFIDDGARTALYDPPDAGTVGSGTGAIDASYNATRNDFWKMDYQLTAPKGRMRMQVTGCGISGTHIPYNWVPILAGTFPVIWDGRDQFGQLVSGTCSIYFDAPDPLKLASVIVRGTVPKITGSGASPNIEVKSNPYKATHSYDQISKITYRVDQDSYVTVKLLPPGISDFANPGAIVLMNNVLKSALSAGTPLDHAIEWKGYDTLDTNNVLVTDEGTYTFAIQATGAVSGITALYRGALQLYR